MYNSYIMGSMEPGIADVLEDVFTEAQFIVTQVTNRISESGITGELKEAIEIRISNVENPLPIYYRIEDHDITQMGMSFIGFYIIIIM